ncbi:TonB-dependent receptor plug domain-containing protein [Flaviaesturariibacter aridisoli]|uniref:TonB-dependent receptor n=1 Tax=Flaviaesturariibacter aridisoli TaxID=2545761 RepID=A0A4R4E771_9BACT|nr:TonB-dependent receptor [Flaviaesturariibacter aridisoli]TCZ73881.1 TonB-dependent receptor [Flaviaesturariibacter aridisoli]
MKRLQMAAFALLVGTAASGQAQEGGIELDPVSVTANFTPLNSSRTGRNLLVIDGARFQKLPVSSIDELLRYVPGIEIQARGPMGAQSDIVLRGGTFQQVLVIVDGLRVNDPFSGHFATYFPIAPAEIERIEVLKGAAAAQYGSEAVGGVVQIITKSFAAKKGDSSKGGSARLSAGQYGLLNGQLGGYYGTGKTTVAGGLLTNNASGVQQRGIRGYFHNTTASASVAHHFNEYWRLALRSSYDVRDFAAQNFYTTFASDTSKEKVKTNWNQLSLAYSKGRERVLFDAGYKYTTDWFEFNTLGAANNNKSGLWQLAARDEHRFGAHTVLTSGLQFNNRSIRSNDRGNHQEQQVAGFTALSYTGAQGLSVAPALRLDWHERRGFELVPQLSVSLRKKAWQLRASAGKTIRDADFTERYNNYNKALVPSGRIGNPDLSAERATALEAGGDLFLGKGFRVSGTYFNRLHTGLIDYVTTPYAQMPRRDNLVPGGAYALAQNLADVNIRGGELDLQYLKRTRKGAELQASAGLTWAEAESKNGVAGFYLTSFAKYLVNGSISYSTRRLELGFTALYKERAAAQSASAIKAELAKDYFVLNGKAQFFVLPARLGVFVQADNLFNKTYSDLLGAQMPGRWIQAGAQFKF